MANRQLRGCGLAINDIADDTWRAGERMRFPNALTDHNGTPLTLRERSMIAFMDEITDKPDWMRKIEDEAILRKWRLERAEKEQLVPPERALSESMFDYCIQELRDYAKYQQKMGFVAAIAADTFVFKSDTQISKDLNIKLRAAVTPLEDIPENEKDWHPGSDERVFDLVHPSLFPLLYGRTRILPEGIVPLEHCGKYIGNGEIVSIPAEQHLQVHRFGGVSHWTSRREPHFFSAKFQWLPCQVDFLDNGSTQISSYINNLHPQGNKSLYEILEKIIDRVVPMWDATLTHVDQGRRTPRIDDVTGDYIEPEGREPPSPNTTDYSLYDDYHDWHRANRILIMPEPGKYLARESTTSKWQQKQKPVNLREDFAEQGLQIIVKLANIHLTPEKSQYDGGAWHIEGQMNEHICASAIYYYDSENVTDSYLSFREATSIDYLEYKPYEQGDFEHFERLYDIQDQGPATQVLGKVNTKEGRLLTFPNVLQHCVHPFELADKSRPGHRKILALFLVDPYTPIPSTAHVPPQQKDWWRSAVCEDKRVSELPRELVDMIAEADDYTIELEEAKRIRLELMEERRMFVDDVEERFQQETFGFCEH